MPTLKPPDPGRSRSLWYATGLGFIAIAGVLPRTYGIATRSLWFDEAFAWRIITFPVLEMIGRLARDNNPPLYFLLLKAWTTAFGTSEIALRSLSVLFGAATIIASAEVAREIIRARRTGPTLEATGRVAGLIAAALVAASVVQIRWAWESWMYTLGTALAASTSWAMLRALRTKSLRGWIGYGLLALLFAYTHYYALFSLIAQAVYAAGSILWDARGRPARVVASPNFRRSLLAAGIMVVGWSPWVPVFLAQRQRVEGDFWIRPVRFEHVTWGMCRLFLIPENGRFNNDVALATSAVAGLAVLGLLACRPRGGEVYLVLAAVLPLAIPITLSRFGLHVFYWKYLLFGHLHLIIGVGVLVARIRDLPSRIATASLLVAGSLVLDFYFINLLRIPDKPGMRAAMTLVNAERRPGEPIVASMSLIHSPMLYYVADPRNCYLYDDGTPVPHFRGAQIILPGEMADARALASYRSGRVWAVDMRSNAWGVNSVPHPAGWKRVAEYSFPEVYDMQGEIVIALYEVAAE